MFRRTVVKVEAIKEDESTIVQLIEIFDIKKTEKDIKEDIYSLEFWEERKIELAEWHKKDLEIKNIIADYHNGYDVLTTKIQENREDRVHSVNVTFHSIPRIMKNSLYFGMLHSS